MIAVDLLRAVRVAIAHGYPDGPCPDGLASAMVVKDVLPDAEVRFVSHNTREHDELCAEPNTLFVDMVPPEKRVAEFVAAGAIVLDHHQSSRHLVEAFGERGIFGDEATQPGVSGAVLAFEQVWLPLAQVRYGEHARVASPPPDLREIQAEETERVRCFAELAGVRDTWQTADPRWRRACMQAKVLRFFPAADWLEADGDPLNEERLRRRMEMLGEVLMRKDEEESRKLVANAYHFVTERGLRVAVLPSTYVSDASVLLADVADVVVGFNYRAGNAAVPDLRLSFRSRGAVDVAAIAKTLGGGGHTNAAGAAVSTLLHREGDHYDESTSRNPYSEIKYIFHVFERTRCP